MFEQARRCFLHGSVEAAARRNKHERTRSGARRPCAREMLSILLSRPYCPKNGDIGNRPKSPLAGAATEKTGSFAPFGHGVATAGGSPHPHTAPRPASSLGRQLMGDDKIDPTKVVRRDGAESRILCKCER